MKLLLDEIVPHQMRRCLPPHAAYLVRFMLWDGLLNGALLRRAAADDFDALPACDTNIKHQHNLTELPLAVVVMHAKTTDIEDLAELIEPVLLALENLQPCTLVHVYAPRKD